MKEMFTCILICLKEMWRMRRYKLYASTGYYVTYPHHRYCRIWRIIAIYLFKQPYFKQGFVQVSEMTQLTKILNSLTKKLIYIPSNIFQLLFPTNGKINYF